MNSTSATVLPLRDYRTDRRAQFFTRSELNQLLGLYSRNVSRGVWRDYAIDHRDGRALFSVFRHTHESALYTIIKSKASPVAPAEFLVMSGRQRLSTGPTLADALEFFLAASSCWSPTQIGPGGRECAYPVVVTSGHLRRGSIRSRIPSRRMKPCISAAPICAANSA